MDERPSVYEDENGRLQRADARLDSPRVTAAEEITEALEKLGSKAPEHRKFQSPANDGRKYATVDQFWNEHKKREATAQAREDELAEIDRKNQARLQRDRIRAAGTISKDEQAALGQISQRMQAVQTVDQVRARAAEYLRQNPANAAQVQQYLAALEQRVAPHRQQLASELAAVETFGRAKRLERGHLELKQIDPELAKPERREDLVKYLVKNGIAESRARSERDPTIIGLAWKQMLAEEAREDEDAVRAEVARRSQSRNLNPLHGRSYEDGKGAFAGLRSRGRMADALEYLAVRRDEREVRGSRRR